jgi:RimJ/RimL family protein N-acetyltransferase/DNA-binding transcriptional ArsR family regulator
MTGDLTYRAIADDTRRQILDLLAQHGTLAAGQIARRLPGLSRPAVSRHLRILRQAQLVAVERRYLDRQAEPGQRPVEAPVDVADGREQLYRLSPQPLELVQQWVVRYRGYWTDKLEALALQAEGPASAAHPPGQWGQTQNTTGPTTIAPRAQPGLPLPPVPMRPPRPVILSGPSIQLVALTEQALPFIVDALQYPAIWRFSVQRMAVDADAAEYLKQALDDTAAGRAQAFGIMVRPGVQGVERTTFAGSTRFGNISLENGRVEIGWTWVLPQFQRSGVNREAKLLLLTYAFEELGARRVEFKGDARNMKSHNALLGIGATYEGTLRRHMALPDGTSRDSFFFSVISEEWPQVKARLRGNLPENRPPGQLEQSGSAAI